MVLKKKKTYNRHKLMMTETVEKFYKAITQILSGEFLYKTIDGRIVDFRQGTEKQTYSHFFIKRPNSRDRDAIY